MWCMIVVEPIEKVMIIRFLKLYPPYISQFYSVCSP